MPLANPEDIFINKLTKEDLREAAAELLIDLNIQKNESNQSFKIFSNSNSNNILIHDKEQIKLNLEEKLEIDTDTKSSNYVPVISNTNSSHYIPIISDTKSISMKKSKLKNEMNKKIIKINKFKKNNISKISNKLINIESETDDEFKDFKPTPLLDKYLEEQSNSVEKIKEDAKIKEDSRKKEDIRSILRHRSRSIKIDEKNENIPIVEPTHFRSISPSFFLRLSNEFKLSPKQVSFSDGINDIENMEESGKKKKFSNLNKGKTGNEDDGHGGVKNKNNVNIIRKKKPKAMNCMSFHEARAVLCLSHTPFIPIMDLNQQPQCFNEKIQVKNKMSNSIVKISKSIPLTKSINLNGGEKKKQSKSVLNNTIPTNNRRRKMDSIGSSCVK